MPRVRQLEAALALRERAGEGALLVAEQLALDDRLGQRREVDLDEGLRGAAAVVVDRRGDELLADAALAADQHRGVALGDLGDQVVDRLHRLGVADDVRGAEAVLELLLEALVLLDEPLALLLGGLAQAHRLGDHRGDDRQQAHVLGEVDLLGEEPVDRERADDLVAELDRHADEGDVPLLEALAGAGAVEEERVLRDARDDGGLAGLHDLAGDPLAEAVAPALLLARGEAVGRLDGDLAGVAVEQRQAAAEHPHVVGHRLEDGVDALAQVEGAVEDLADLEEQGEFLHLAADFGWCGSVRHVTPPRSITKSRSCLSMIHTKLYDQVKFRSTITGQPCSGQASGPVAATSIGSLRSPRRPPRAPRPRARADCGHVAATGCHKMGVS